MNIHISPENEQFIQSAIDSGAFTDPRQVLDEALSLLKKREALRHDVEAGLAQLDRGEGRDAEKVFTRLLERADALHSSKSPNK
ncbi:MAG: type II toxin-antitoxin system ParD family antitoxin [Planctomycetota bacterium]